MDFEGLKDLNELSEDERRRVRQALFDFWETKKMECGLADIKDEFTLGTCELSDTYHWNTPFSESHPCRNWVPLEEE